MPRYQKSS